MAQSLKSEAFIYAWLLKVEEISITVNAKAAALEKARLELVELEDNLQENRRYQANSHTVSFKNTKFCQVSLYTYL